MVLFPSQPGHQNLKLLVPCSQPGWDHAGGVQTGQPGLMRSRHLGHRTLHCKVHPLTRVIAPAALHSIEPLCARGAVAQRKWRVFQACWCAKGVNPCGTAGGRARRRTGKRTSLYANACELLKFNLGSPLKRPLPADLFCSGGCSLPRGPARELLCQHCRRMCFTKA